MVRRTALPKTGALFSVIFNATFVEAIRETICDNTGADTNVMGAPLLDRFQEAGNEVSIEKLPKPRVFHTAAYRSSGAHAKLACERATVIDRELHVRHSTSINIRRLRWRVSITACAGSIARTSHTLGPAAKY